MNSKKDYKKVQDSRIVSVTELLLELFKRIKLIMLAAVVFAVALGGYKYIKDKKSADISPAGVNRRGGKKPHRGRTGTGKINRIYTDISGKEAGVCREICIDAAGSV